MLNQNKVVICLSLILMGNVSIAENLTVEKYLDQVRSSQGVFKSSKVLVEAAPKIEKEKDVMKWSLIGFAKLRDDQTPKPSPVAQGYETIDKTFSLGVQHITRFGLTAKLAYDLYEADVRGAVFLPRPVYATGMPSLELTQSLLRNGFGSEVRAQQDVAESQARSTYFNESFRARSTLFQAELAYIRLATAQATVELQKDLLGRSEKIVSWAKRRADSNLSDKADLFQAEAGNRLRQLEYQSAVDEARSASVQFNNFRGVSADTVSETVKLNDVSDLIQMKSPKLATVREDVKALEYGLYTQQASSQLSKEKNRPTLDVSAKYAYGSNEVTKDEAIKTSFKGIYPYWEVGLKLQVPLMFGAASDAAEGRESEKLAAELGYRQRVFEAQQDLSDLLKKLEETKRKLQITNGLVKIQETKMNYERNRLLNGRTTTFQVLSFEQDYAQSQLSHLRSEGEILKIIAQLKLYQEGQP